MKPANNRLKQARSLLGLVNAQGGNRTKRAGNAPRGHSEGIEINAKTDVRYMHVAPQFDNCVHVFHHNWHGIRSACGTLPGHKASIPTSPNLKPTDLARFAGLVDEHGIRKVVFHGFSANADRLLDAARGGGLDTYLVWHGNAAQLAWDHESRIYELASRRHAEGAFKRAHVLKAGEVGLFPGSFKKLLLNQPPALKKRRLESPFAGETPTALVPAFNDIRKNVYANLIGCAYATRLKRTLYFADVIRLPVFNETMVHTTYSGHHANFDLLSQTDVVVNATLIDCHPMVDLEALGAGTPAITGPLHLDALKDHAYTAMSEVENPLDPTLIAESIDRVAQMPPGEIDDILADYTGQLRAISIARYGEFLFG